MAFGAILTDKFGFLRPFPAHFQTISPNSWPINWGHSNHVRDIPGFLRLMWASPLRGRVLPGSASLWSPLATGLTATLSPPDAKSGDGQGSRPTRTLVMSLAHPSP